MTRTQKSKLTDSAGLCGVINPNMEPIMTREMLETLKARRSRETVTNTNATAPTKLGGVRVQRAARRPTAKRNYKWAATELEKMAAEESDPKLRALWKIAAAMGRQKAGESPSDKLCDSAPVSGANNPSVKP